MKTNDKSIPEEIFNWIAKKPFEDLNASEKVEVLQHFSEEDYQDMHVAWTGIEQVKESQVDQQKQSLLARFDKKHTGGGVIHNLMRKPVEFWKVAAVLVPFVLAVLFVQTINGGKKENQQVVIRDTVYVKLPGATITEVIRDTLVKLVNVSPILKETAPAQEEGNTQQPLTENDLTVLTIADLQNTANRVKRNSLQEDSLLVKFAPVSL